MSKTHFHGLAIDPIARTIKRSAGAILVQAMREQQRWVYDVGIWVEVFGHPRRKDIDKDHTLGAMRMATGDKLFVDDDGYQKEGLGIFYLDGYPNPLCGNAMVVSARQCLDDEIYGVPSVDIEQLRRWVRWTDTVTSGEVMPPTVMDAAEMARLLPNIPNAEEYVRRMKMEGIKAGHPIPRPASIAGHIYQHRDGE